MNGDAAEVVAPAAEPVEDVAIPAEESSLADHEAAYGRSVDPSLKPDEQTAVTEKRERIRHRAKSQQATPGDAPRIAELTRKLREAEEQLKAVRTPQSQPVARQEPAPETRQSAAVVTQPAAEVSDKFTYPTYAEALGKTPDLDYDAWQDAKDEARYQWRKAKDTAATQAAQQQQEHSQRLSTYKERATSFAKDHNDYDTLLSKHEQEGVTIPAPAYHVILTNDNGPAMLYHLLSHPDQLAEMHFLMAGKPATNETVAHATRWLSSRMQAAPTGSVAPTPPVVTAPRPPNPVRTGALKTADDPPGDASSLGEHEKAYGKRFGFRG